MNFFQYLSSQNLVVLKPKRKRIPKGIDRRHAKQHTLKMSGKVNRAAVADFNKKQSAK